MLQHRSLARRPHPLALHSPELMTLLHLQPILCPPSESTDSPASCPDDLVFWSQGHQPHGAPLILFPRLPGSAADWSTRPSPSYPFRSCSPIIPHLYLLFSFVYKRVQIFLPQSFCNLLALQGTAHLPSSHSSKSHIRGYSQLHRFCPTQALVLNLPLVARLLPISNVPLPPVNIQNAIQTLGYLYVPPG